MKKRQWKAFIFIKNIVSNKYLLILFILFDVYDLLLKHFVSWHGHMDLPRCENIGKERVWGHKMIRYMVPLMPWTCAHWG
jgi:hypothetical protein